MAGRSATGGSASSDINERRLRPIYDCLDSGNNKKALQEADRLLKKQKDLHCAKALKALSLIRLSRQEEAIPLLHEVHALKPHDENTLQAMAMSYRDVCRLDLIADMYESASKARPDSEDILNSLFMSYVRLGNYKKQQQAGMTLHKLKPQKNPYYFWSVMSIVMQAEDDKKLGQTMFLPLAEKMTLKYIQEGKLEAEAEVRLYLIILDCLGKYTEALNVLHGPLAEKLTSEPDFRQRYEAELLVKLERWSEAGPAYKRLLLDSPDNWMFYKEYLSCSLQSLIGESDSQSEARNSDDTVATADDTTLSDVVEFLTAQVVRLESSETSYPLRGPYLAQLELLRVLKERGNSAWMTLLGSPVDLLDKYCERFGSKSCCFTDLADFIQLLTADQLNQWISTLSEKVCLKNSDGSIVFPKDIGGIQRHILVVQLSRYAGQHVTMSQEQILGLVDELILRYRDGLKFGADISKTGVQFVDWNVLMAAHMLHDLYKANESNGWQYLFRAILLLEEGLIKSPSNSQLVLLLIRLFSDLGAAGVCMAWFESMDVKHIQYDSIGWVVFNPVLRCGHVSTANSLLDSMLQFFTSVNKDTCDYLISAYKFGSFPKVKEFIKFRERLQNSVQYASATAEKLLLDITSEPNCHRGAVDVVITSDINPALEKLNLEQLADNRDLDVAFSWDPQYRQIIDEYKKQSYKDELSWLQLRNLTVRCVIASVLLSESAVKQSTDGSVNGERARDGATESTKGLVDMLGQLISELSDCLQRLEAESGAGKQSISETAAMNRSIPLMGPARSRLSTYLTLGLGSHLLRALEILVHFSSVQHDSGSSTIEESSKPAPQLDMSSLCDTIAAQQLPILDWSSSSDSRTFENCSFHSHILENITLCAETISVLTVLAGCYHTVLKPIKSALNKKGKKRKEVDQNKTSALELYSVLYTDLTRATELLNTAVQQSVPEKQLTELLNNLSLYNSTEDNGEINTNNSSNTVKRTNEVDNGTSTERTSETDEGTRGVERTGELGEEKNVDVWEGIIRAGERRVWGKIEGSYLQARADLTAVISRKQEYQVPLRL